MPLTADDRIVLIRVKIERAKKHLRELASDISAVQRLEIVIGNEQAYVPQFSDNVLAGAGDVVHNLRTSLDHLACQLVLVAGNPITNQIYFPIAKDVGGYETLRARIVNCIRPGAIEEIDRLKPYKGGNDALWRIHELDRIDKHRTLFTFSHDFVFYADWFGSSFLFKKDSPAYVGLFDEHVENDMQFEIKKSFGQSQVSGRDAILPSLHQLVDFVDSLLPIFRKHLE